MRAYQRWMVSKYTQIGDVSASTIAKQSRSCCGVEVEMKTLARWSGLSFPF